MTTTKKSWRAVYKVHPAADLFPMMNPDELRDLGEDIKQHGLQHPIIVWSPAPGEPRVVIDGRNRLDAMELVGIKLTDDHYRILLDELDPYEYVLSANVRRRHLTAGQKRTLIAAVLKARPERSNNATANLVGVSDKTVGAVRDDLESRSEIPNVKRVDTKGRMQLTTKRKSPRLPRAAARKMAEADAVRQAASRKQDKPVDTPNPAPAVAPPKTNRETARHQAPVDEWLGWLEDIAAALPEMNLSADAVGKLDVAVRELVAAISLASSAP